MQQAVNKLAEFMDGSGLGALDNFTSEWPAKIDRQVIEKVDENLEKRITHKNPITSTTWQKNWVH